MDDILVAEAEIKEGRASSALAFTLSN